MAHRNRIILNKLRLFLWIFQMLLVLVSAASSLCETPLNRQVLIDFYASTLGPTWAASSRINWNTTVDVFSWFGVSCNGTSIDGIGISNANLTGTLPASLTKLSNLTTLILNENRLSGTLPKAWSAAFPLLADLELAVNNGKQLHRNIAV